MDGKHKLVDAIYAALIEGHPIQMTFGSFCVNGGPDSVEPGGQRASSAVRELSFMDALQRGAIIDAKRKMLRRNQRRMLRPSLPKS